MRGREDLLARTLQSAYEFVDCDFAAVAVSRDPGGLGGSGNIRQGWEIARTLNADYVFHLEDDWLFREPVPVAEMIAVLETHPSLANIILRRQPWGTEGPGGYIGDNPAAFTDRGGWLQHEQGFWLNPCVYPASICERGWPEHGTEADFTATLPPGTTFGVWGSHGDAPRVWHIGDQRSPQWCW